MADEQRTLRDRISEEVVQGFQKSSEVVSRNTREIIGDALNSLIDDVKNFTFGALTFVKGTFKTLTGGLFKKKIEQRNLDQNIEQTSLLEDSLEDNEEQTSLLEDLLGSILDENENQTSLLESLHNIFNKDIFKPSDETMGMQSDEQTPLLKNLLDIEKQNLNSNKEQSPLLENILDIDKKAEKRDARNVKDKKKGILGFLFSLLAGIVGVVVGYLSSALSPFKSLSSVIAPFVKNGFVFEFFSKLLPKSLTSLGKMGKMLGNVFTKISTSFSGIIKAITGSKIFKFGKAIGNLLFFFRFIYDAIREIFSEKSIRDKILGVSAKILALVGEIPELIINGLFKLFGSDMRVDFSKEAIINAVNKFSDWLFKNFTEPFFDFLLIDIPSFFSNLIDKLKPSNLFKDINIDSIVSNLKSLISPILDIPMKIENWLVEKINSLIEKFNLSEIFSAINIDSIVSNLKDLMAPLVEIPMKIKNWLGDKITALIDKLPPFLKPEEQQNDNQIAGEALNEDTFGRLKELFALPESIKKWFKEKIEAIINKVPKFLLPESLENFNFDDAQQTQQNVNIPNDVKSSEVPLIEPKTNAQEINDLKMETQKTNEKLDRLIMATESNGKATNNFNNSVIANQNNSSGGKQIPSSNENFGLHLMNGAMG